jgi:uncharacterized repeat protein (TIGR01451 family)
VQSTADDWQNDFSRPPAWFRYGVVAVATLILCSCQTVRPTQPQQSPGIPAGMQLGPQSLGPQANQLPYPPAEMPRAAMPRRQVMPVVYQQDLSRQQNLNAPPTPQQQAQYAAGVMPVGCQLPGCQFPGCACCENASMVGPRDEYLCDGGDKGLPAGVKEDWRVTGLEQEDTVAHYDTVDGRTIITPSNQVCIYAPRFGVVRRVVDLQEYARYDAANGYGQITALAKIDENEKVATSLGKLEPNINRGRDPASLLRERQQSGELDREMRLAAEVGTLAPYANLQIVKVGTITGEEKVKIARASLAAITWTGDEAPQIAIGSRNAVAAVSDRQPGVVYHLEEPNKPVLRIVKLASCGAAKPGEIIEFTLRVDNIGNREMGNVTVVDNLTTRLEYVPDSAKASVAADFSTEPNDGGSEVLRWEIRDPLAKGAGCILQFNCKVR